RVRVSEQLFRWCRRKPLVAGLLGSVLLLLLVIAVGASRLSWQLQKNLQRAERAEDQANRRLYESLVTQARANRRSGKAGQRFDSLKALGEAAQLARELNFDGHSAMELRNEAIACLPFRDVAKLRPIAFATSTRHAD